MSEFKSVFENETSIVQLFFHRKRRILFSIGKFCLSVYIYTNKGYFPLS